MAICYLLDWTRLDGIQSTILINYDHIPARCRFCLFLNHCVSDCISLKLNGVGDPQASSHTPCVSSNVGPSRSPPQDRSLTVLVTPPKQPSPPINRELQRPPPSRGPLPPPRPNAWKRVDSEGFTLVSHRKKNKQAAHSSPCHPSLKDNHASHSSKAGPSQHKTPSSPSPLRLSE